MNWSCVQDLWETKGPQQQQEWQPDLCNTSCFNSFHPTVKKNCYFAFESHVCQV